MIAPRSPPADSHRAPSRPGRLTRRADFLRIAAGRKARTGAFTLQMRPSMLSGPARFGLTVSRKTGTAVVRNRVRRRLRAALRSMGGLAGNAGHDYVIIARREVLAMPFATLIEALAGAMRDIHNQPTPRSAVGRGPRASSRS
jgi:ribonuclease P protein component